MMFLVLFSNTQSILNEAALEISLTRSGDMFAIGSQRKNTQYIATRMIRSVTLNSYCAICELHVPIPGPALLQADHIHCAAFSQVD